MAQFITAVLLITLVGVSHSSDPLATARSKFVVHLSQREVKSTRQTCDPISQTCINETTELANELTGVTSADDFNSSLDSYCRSSCFSESVAYYDCIGVEDTDLVCAKNANGNYCDSFFLTLDVNAYSCGVGTCDTFGTTDCQSLLQTTSDDLGCCATIVLGQSQYDTCNVATAAQCSGPEIITTSTEIITTITPSSGAGIISHVGLGLFTVFVMAAAFLFQSCSVLIVRRTQPDDV